jgi:pyridoxamine 5'-phosphate oxidase
LSASEAARLRAQLQAEGLDVADVAADPVEQFRAWHAIWHTVCDDEPDAMIVATADAAGRPSARNVLLRDLDERGFVFFTNYESRKGQDLSVNAAVSLVFSWVPIGRQVVVLGRAERCSPAESDAYFVTRPRASQVSAWASDQSREVADRSVLEERHRTYDAEFAGGDVPRPPHWGGIRVVPQSLELWQGRPDRMHDRLRYEPDAGAGGWRIVRLCP